MGQNQHHFDHPPLEAPAAIPPQHPLSSLMATSASPISGCSVRDTRRSPLPHCHVERPKHTGSVAVKTTSFSRLSLIRQLWALPTTFGLALQTSRNWSQWTRRPPNFRSYPTLSPLPSHRSTNSNSNPTLPPQFNYIRPSQPRKCPPTLSVQLPPRPTRTSVAATGPNAKGGNALANNTLDPTTDEVHSDEPDGDFTPIYTGRFVWSAKKADKPLVPYEELPFKKSDRAKLPALTVRWEFTGRFSLKREEDIARGSLRVQARRYLQRQGVTAPECVVNFPEGVGRNRFVDIRVPLEQFLHLKNTPLVFNGSRLQRVFIGPAFPPNYLVIEIGNVPPYNVDKITARQIALAFRQFVEVHDIWISQVSYADDPTPPVDTNRWVALVSVPMETEGGIDPNKFHAIPGYIRLLENECTLAYTGRLDWCTTCKSQAEYLHAFNHCPRQRCFTCGKTGHRAAMCIEEVAVAYDDDAMAGQQANDDAKGADQLDYGTA